MTSEVCRGQGGQTAYTPRRQEGGFIRSIVNHRNSLYRGREDERCGSELALCLLVGFTPDCVIIQWSVHQITLGLVTAACIRFTALYIHLLTRVKNSGVLNNWIK